MPGPLEIWVTKVSRILYAVLALLVLLGDQITKSVVERSIPLHAVVPVLPGYFNLIDTQNSGVAFSLFSDSPSPWKTATLVAVSIALLATVVIIVLKTHHLEWESGVGLALILGGAVSNLADRIRYGKVVDFLDVYYRTYHWPTFNLADSAIVVGAALLMLQLIFFERRANA